MVSFKVLLDSFEKVKSFVELSARYPFDIDLSSGRYVVDGKSIMGIFSFDLTRPVEVRVNSDDEVKINAFKADIADFLLPEEEGTAK